MCEFDTEKMITDTNFKNDNVLQEGRRECLPVRGCRPEYLIFLTCKNCAFFIFEYMKV